DPVCDACLFELSRYDFKENRVDQAIARINESIKISPTNQWYITARGEYLMDAGQFSATAKDFRWLIDRESKNLDDYYNLINSHLYQEQGEKAIAVFGEMENVFGSGIETSVQKLDLIRRIGTPENELAELESLIAKQEHEATWYTRKAEVLQTLGRNDEAFQVLEESTKLSSSSGAIYLQLAEWYQSKNNKDKGLEMLAKAYKDPSLSSKLKVSALAYYFNENLKGSEYDSVMELISTLQTDYPKEADVFIAKGDFYALAGQNLEAVEEYKKALLIDPAQLSTWEQVMEIQHSQMSWMDLLESSMSAMELFPTQPFAYLMNGTALLNIDNYTDAVSSLKSGQMMVFDDPFTQAQFAATLGQTYHQMMEYDDSDLSFDKAIELDGNNPYVLNNYAYYLSLRKDKLEKARSLITRCID
ncbi:MAG: tetratricopeptide repeat protein, partial [Flavobacteriales bacterium]